MLGILLIAKPCKVCRVFCWTRHMYKRSIFSARCSQHYKTKQNAKTVLVQLAFPINAHQNANQKRQSEVCLHTGRSVHFHPSRFTRPSFSIFRGSGSETTHPRGVQAKMKFVTTYCDLIAATPGQRGLEGLVTCKVSSSNVCFCSWTWQSLVFCPSFSEVAIVVGTWTTNTLVWFWFSFWDRASNVNLEQ